MFFSKYNASGNDFILTHTFVEKDYSALAVSLCDRHEGIGADGLVVLLPHENLDFKWLFYNSDGSVADMCGNASRAAGHYAHAQGIAEEKMRFLSGAGEIGVRVVGDMVETQLTPPKILNHGLNEAEQTWWLIDTGVPHMVAFYDVIDRLDIDLCRKLRHKYNANINFATMNNGKLHVRTYERGVEDETLACGTGMAAAFLRAYKEGRCSDKCEVLPKSGETLYLKISGENLFFKGKVKKVFDTFQTGE